MADALVPSEGLPAILAHPLTITAAGAGCALFTVLSYHAFLAAIPPGCQRGSIVMAIPAVACMLLLVGSIVALYGGLLFRLKPDLSWHELAWHAALGQCLTHAVAFTLIAAVYMTADTPPGCGSPSTTELALVGLVQTAHSIFLVRRARRLARAFGGGRS